jgi:hypothetical protein
MVRSAVAEKENGKEIKSKPTHGARFQSLLIIEDLDAEIAATPGTPASEFNSAMTASE